jgi:hypothetical protein
MSEENDKINRIATMIDSLREEIAQIREELKTNSAILKEHQEKFGKLIDSLSFVLVYHYGTVKSSELDEVRRLARQKGISVAEMITELEAQGTLPASIKEFREAQKILREMLTTS